MLVFSSAPGVQALDEMILLQDREAVFGTGDEELIYKNGHVD